MTRAAQGDKVVLVAAGVAASPSPAWRGGWGVLIIDNINGTPDFQISHDNGANWVPIKDPGGTISTEFGIDLAVQYLLPPCHVRMSAAGGTMNAILVGI